jgi:hypothetical protein
MANDPSLAELWPNADVLVAPLGTEIPATVNDAWHASWKYVGCLDGDAGFPIARNVEKSDKFFWGGGLLRSTRKNFKLTQKFTAFEGGGEVVAGLAWPGSDLATGVLKVPALERLLVAFEMREGTTKKRLISYYQAEVDLIGEVKDAESEVTMWEFEVTFFPNADFELLLRQPGIGGPVLESLAISGTASVEEGAITSLTATATYDDASTVDVTASADWSSDDTDTATVPYGSGFVVGVEAGTADITATYGGQTDTETVTVTAP